MIDPRRLVAPREQLGVLIEPQAEAIRACVARDVAAGFDAVPILDTTLGALRARLRQRLQLNGPVILTGHQAEFFHAGVFAKTIAADALAATIGGTPVFLTVDSDVPKAKYVAIPHIDGERVRRALVPIPGCDPRLPVEGQPRVPAAEWRDFFARLGAHANAAEPSFLDVFADGWFAADEHAVDFCDGIVRGHAAVERALGLGGSRDVRTSQLGGTPEFRALTAHLILHAPAFAAQYNEAQRSYRRRFGVRNAQRPAPLLETGADRTESPFWVSRDGAPRRRLHVADSGKTVEFFADDQSIGVVAKADFARNEFHEHPWPVEADGWRVRLRALTLSAFARLLMADLFIHGIGGAKYDRMTEDFVRRFFDVELVPMCCVSATVYLPLPRQGGDIQELRAARRQFRDARYNPQRYVPDAPAELVRRREELIRQSAALRKDRRRAHAERREVFQAIRHANAELLRRTPTLLAELGGQVRRSEQQGEFDRIALDREVFFALHARSDLQRLVQKIRTHVGPP